MYSYSRLQRGFLHLQQPFQPVTQTELSVIACHFSDQMMRYNRLCGSRLLSSSGMTVFNDLLTAFNALSQWTSLTTYGIRHRATGFHCPGCNTYALCLTSMGGLHQPVRSGELMPFYAGQGAYKCHSLAFPKTWLDNDLLNDSGAMLFTKMQSFMHIKANLPLFSSKV